MRVIGLVTSFGPLNEKEPEGLHRLSVEGFSMLVRSEMLENGGIPKAGEVECVVSVFWKKGKRPVFWLETCRELVGAAGA